MDVGSNVVSRLLYGISIALLTVAVFQNNAFSIVFAVLAMFLSSILEEMSEKRRNKYG